MQRIDHCVFKPCFPGPGDPQERMVGRTFFGLSYQLFLAHSNKQDITTTKANVGNCQVGYACNRLNVWSLYLFFVAIILTLHRIGWISFRLY